MGALLVDLEDLLAFFIPLHGEAGVKAPVEFAHVPDGGLGEVIPVVGNGGDPGFQGLVLPDALAVDGELSLVLAVDAGEAADEGGFPRAVGAHKAIDASRGDGQAHAVQGGEAVEALDGVGNLNHRVSSLRAPAGAPPDGSSSRRAMSSSWLTPRYLSSARSSRAFSKSSFRRTVPAPVSPVAKLPLPGTE